MGWKIIDIESNSQVKLFLNNLIIFKEFKKVIIPLCDVDVVVFDNIKTTLTIRLINQLTKNNILTIICNEKHLPTINSSANWKFQFIKNFRKTD